MPSARVSASIIPPATSPCEPADGAGADGLLLALRLLLGVADRLLLGQRRGGRGLLGLDGAFELLAAQRALAESAASASASDRFGPPPSSARAAACSLAVAPATQR